MGKEHSKSFFGQNTGLIINTSSETEPYIFLRCIKRKHDGIWEKPSKGEGKVIKCSLEEIVLMLSVLNRKQLNWSSYHSYKDNKTQISFGWEDEKAKTLWINIGNYAKMLNFAQAEVLRLLLTHVLKEKIKFATCLNQKNFNDKLAKNRAFDEKYNEPSNGNQFSSQFTNKYTDFKENYDISLFEEINGNAINNKNSITSNVQSDKFKNQEMSQIDGEIKGETEKALLINFKSGHELWIPKSTIHCQYTLKKDIDQKFLIDNWILKRNKVIT